MTMAEGLQDQHELNKSKTCRSLRTVKNDLTLDLPEPNRRTQLHLIHKKKDRLRDQLEPNKKRFLLRLHWKKNQTLDQADRSRKPLAQFLQTLKKKTRDPPQDRLEPNRR